MSGTLSVAALILATGLSAEDPPTAPPTGATVLFDGKSLDSWTSKRDMPAGWKVEKGYMEVVPGFGDIWTKQKFGPNFQLHLEFWIPKMPDKKGQARGNSGVYLQGRYEIQILDSFENNTYSMGECGSLYGIIPAAKKASKPPEQWQTYDITFRAPKVANGKVVEKGEVTVVHNGVTVIDKGRFEKTTAGAQDENIAEPGPIRLQDHGDRLRFRNVWIKPLEPRN